MPAPKPRDEVVESEKFPGKWNVAAISQNRHLENLQKADERNFIDPPGVGIKIPHLPEKTTNEAAGGQRDEGPPVAPGKEADESFVSPSGVNGFQDKKE